MSGKIIDGYFPPFQMPEAYVEEHINNVLNIALRRQERKCKYGMRLWYLLQADRLKREIDEEAGCESQPASRPSIDGGEQLSQDNQRPCIQTRYQRPDITRSGLQETATGLRGLISRVRSSLSRK